MGRMGLFKTRSRAADLVFGGALGAYIGIGFTNDALSTRGYVGLVALLFLLPIGVNFIILTGEAAARRRWRTLAQYGAGSIVYIGLLYGLSYLAGWPWQIEVIMLGTWLAYSVVSGLLTYTD